MTADSSGHPGLSIGMHGRKIEDVDSSSFEFIRRLVESSESAKYSLNRLYLGKQPLKLVIVGENFPNSNEKFWKFIDSIYSPSSDCVSTDNFLQKASLDRNRKGFVQYNGFPENIETSQSTMSLSQRLSDEMRFEKILSDLVLRIKKTSGRVYHQTHLNHALVHAPNYSEESVGGSRITVNHQHKDLTAKIQNAGISYALLIPRSDFALEYSSPFSREVMDKKIRESATTQI